MSWDAIAAIAEGLGAIGVIATVIYLAFQIRQNTNSIQGSTQQALMSQEISIYALLAQYSNVFRRGCASIEDLDADEVVTFEYLVSAFLSQSYSAYVQYQRNLITESVWAAYLADYKNIIENPGFRLAWSKIRSAFPIEFCQCLDDAEKNTNRAT